MSQKEHAQIMPRPGWVEHDPIEIRDNTLQVIEEALHNLDVRAEVIEAIGITNQRETTVLWNKNTGNPCYNALVWQDTRTDKIIDDLAGEGGTDRLRERTGLPLATYFSAAKIQWILDNTPGLRKQAESGNILFGTMDTWVIWNLTGGKNGGIHVTDVTNASRTQLMDLRRICWDKELLDLFRIPVQILPEIKPSVSIHPYGYFLLNNHSIPINAALGDQQAALFGQTCFQAGEAKNTYGTGCFLLLNTGENLVHSRHGLITTLAFQKEGQRPRYALEGSVAIAGALVQWLRDNLGLIKHSSEIEDLAASVNDNGGVYFVPAFSGLYAPYWERDARGIITGLTRYANRGHIARAVLEASAFQTWELTEAMTKDAGLPIPELRVDGGMVVNNLFMQFQSDILGIDVLRPFVIETTALGAAYAAGLASGFWQNEAELRSHWQLERKWSPGMDETESLKRKQTWLRAVQKSMGWVQE